MKKRLNLGKLLNNLILDLGGFFTQLLNLVHQRAFGARRLQPFAQLVSSVLQVVELEITTEVGNIRLIWEFPTRSSMVS